jgi:hypothetical protein
MCLAGSLPTSNFSSSNLSFKNNEKCVQCYVQKQKVTLENWLRKLRHNHKLEYHVIIKIYHVQVYLLTYTCIDITSPKT